MNLRVLSGGVLEVEVPRSTPSGMEGSVKDHSILLLPIELKPDSASSFFVTESLIRRAAMNRMLKTGQKLMEGVPSLVSYLCGKENLPFDPELSADNDGDLCPAFMESRSYKETGKSPPQIEEQAPAVLGKERLVMVNDFPKEFQSWFDKNSSPAKNDGEYHRILTLQPCHVVVECLETTPEKERAAPAPLEKTEEKVSVGIPPLRSIRSRRPPLRYLEYWSSQKTVVEATKRKAPCSSGEEGEAERRKKESETEITRVNGPSSSTLELCSVRVEDLSALAMSSDIKVKRNPKNARITRLEVTDSEGSVRTMVVQSARRRSLK